MLKRAMPSLMAPLYAALWALSVMSKYFGTTTAAKMPRMMMSEMSSMRVKAPSRLFCFFCSMGSSLVCFPARPEKRFLFPLPGAPRSRLVTVSKWGSPASTRSAGLFGWGLKK
jgi:hypothetical protein